MLERLLRPRSVAIIGASATPGSLGASVLANLERFGYGGDIHLVNPNRSAIGQRPCLASAELLPEGVDCAVLAIPNADVTASVAACGRRGVAGAIVFSAGFAETGAEGIAAQQALSETARRHGVAVEGPNCLGMINFVDGVPLTFGAVDPAPLDGRRAVALVSQSGAMAVTIRAALAARDVAVSFLVSTGNEATHGVEEFVAFLLDDTATDAIVLFVEQFRRPQHFLRLADAARAAGKTILLLHPGRGAAARQSAQTHTGALTGDHAVMRALVGDRGVIVADTLEELIDLAELSIRCPPLLGAGVAVITDSGAFKGLALDLCEDLQLALPSLSEASHTALQRVMPAFAPVSNPLDLTAQALIDLQLYRKTLEPLLADPAFGCVVLAVILSNPAAASRKLPPIIDALRELRAAKPVLFGMLGEDAEVPAALIAELRALDVPFFRSPERALRALAPLARARAGLAREARSIVVPTLPAGVLTEYQAKQVLHGWGIAVPAGELVTDTGGARDAAMRVGFPVALKAQSSDLPHKTEAGGVVLGIGDESAVSAGWNMLHANVARARPGLRLDGVLVEAMQPRGVEMIVGARRDPDWGPVVMVGLGGIWAEALRDVRVLPPHLPVQAIEVEIRALRGAAVLGKFRNHPAADITAVARIAATLGAVMLQSPRLQEVEINPLLVHEHGAVALDALIVVAQEGSA